MAVGHLRCWSRSQTARCLIAVVVVGLAEPGALERPEQGVNFKIDNNAQQNFGRTWMRQESEQLKL